MSKNMQCDACEKEATVHLTQIINGKVHKVDLCEECSQKLGVTDPNGFSVEDLLSKNLLEEEGTENSGSCECCGYTRLQFKKTGRLGCSSCYEAFSEMVTPILKNIHRELAHTGKVPQAALDRRQYFDKLSKLEEDLRESVATENYEKAAELRDAIHSLKTETEDADNIKEGSQ